MKSPFFAEVVHTLFAAKASAPCAILQQRALGSTMQHQKKTFMRNRRVFCCLYFRKFCCADKRRFGALLKTRFYCRLYPFFCRSDAALLFRKSIINNNLLMYRPVLRQDRKKTTIYPSICIRIIEINSIRSVDGKNYAVSKAVNCGLATAFASHRERRATETRKTYNICTLKTARTIRRNNRTCR